MDELIDRTIAILAANAPRWGILADSIDFELLARRPEPGEWSALQCLGHAADTEVAVFGRRVEAIRDGQPRLARYEPDVEGTPITSTTDPAELVARHASGRARNLAMLATLTTADLGKTSIHEELGEVSLAELLNEWAAHDLMHIVQAERALMQPFIEASGPWRGYFVEHDVRARGAAHRD